MREMWRLVNLIFPSMCPSCSRPTDNLRFAPLCKNCWEGMKPDSSKRRCLQCGISLQVDYSFTCISCIKEKPFYDRLFVFGDYDGPLREAVNLLKFHKVKRLSSPLGGLMAPMDIPRQATLVPVPLSKKRLIQRGFNQSLLLARKISERRLLPLENGLLFKTSDTPPQSRMPRKERLRNQKGAFTVNTGFSGDVPERIVLVDDVMTTGATLNECARVLKKRGVSEVYGAVLARSKAEP